nr:uncharacterized protein LOC115260515 [Aedes albopictus]
MDCNPEITEEVLEEASNNQPVVVTLPLDVYNEQAETIRTIQTDVAYIKEQFKVLLQHGMPEGNSTTSVSIESIREIMPLNSTEVLVDFEVFLEKNNNKKAFEKFLASFVLLKKPLREITMLLIEKVFSLYLQTQVNYSGAGGKHPLKSLCSTQVLIKSIVDHSLFDTTEDPATLACAEFRYQMQHVCDRVRTSERRQSATTNRNPTSRKKLRVPLKVEFLNVHDDDEEVDKDAP